MRSNHFWPQREFQTLLHCKIRGNQNNARLGGSRKEGCLQQTRKDFILPLGSIARCRSSFDRLLLQLHQSRLSGTLQLGPHLPRFFTPFWCPRSSVKTWRRIAKMYVSCVYRVVCAGCSCSNCLHVNAYLPVSVCACAYSWGRFCLLVLFMHLSPILSHLILMTSHPLKPEDDRASLVAFHLILIHHRQRHRRQEEREGEG